MNIGIDKINFFTPNAFVDLVKVAKARHIDPNKFTIGIGQDQMALSPLTQDCYTMGANAAEPIVSKEDAEKIDLIVFGTESALDASKSGAVIMQRLLGIQPFVRSIEVKQACYGATAGIMMARDYIEKNPGRKALVIGSDIARYGLATGGEVTQGAGAVAMIISQDPAILTIDDTSVPYTEDIFDFWRPTYSDVAFVDGKFSNEKYISFFDTVWEEYKKRTGKTIRDFKALCFHMPYTKMGRKALNTILDEADEQQQAQLIHFYDESAKYTRRIGNLYTGSLYLGFLSLLNNAHSELEAGDTIGMFSYGSGAVGEFFTGQLVEGFEKHLHPEETLAMFDRRKELTVPEYEDLFTQRWTTDGNESYSCDFDDATFYLDRIEDHKRIYQRRK